MRVEVMQHFGLDVPLNQAGYYETTHLKELMKDVRGAINEGRLIAVCGVIGSGKTVMLRRLQQLLEEEKKLTVSKSLAIEKQRIKLRHPDRGAVLRPVPREAGAHSDGRET